MEKGMTIETVTILLYIWLSVSLVFPLLAVILLRRDRRMKAELAKKDLSNRHYEEMLYASKDGYLTHSVYKSKDYQFAPSGNHAESVRRRKKYVCRRCRRI